MKARVDRFVAPVLAVVVLILHGGVLRHPLFADDYLFLDRVRYARLWQAILQPDPLGNFWRPLTRQVYFWAIAHGFAESAMVCHLINLATFIGILVLLFGIVGRRAGSRAAWTASLIVAVLAAWDVPLLWGSGTQDLFAILFALVALELAERGKFAWSAVAYGLALLSKEVIVLLPALVVLFAWRRDRPLRAAFAAVIPHLLVAIAWAIPWSMRMRTSPNAPVLEKLVPSDGFAAFVHLPQVLLGIEGAPFEPLQVGRVLAGAACALLAVLVLRASNPGPADTPGRLSPILLGGAWTLAGVVPIVLVATIWSAYYYAFALCGIGFLVGAWTRRAAWPVATAGCLVVLLGATYARHTASIGVPIGAWSMRSHIDAAYVRRSEQIVGRFLGSLKRAVPRPPHGSTFFFSGVPGSISFQVLDGPFVRWAYRDSSLRSYFLSQISPERVERGPAFIFHTSADTLEFAGNDGGLTFGTAARAVLQDDLSAARGALRYHLGRWPDDDYASYLFAWVAYAQGDTALSRTYLGKVGMPARAETGESEVLALAAARLAAADTSGARDEALRAIELDPYDPAAHVLYVRATFGNPRFRTRTLIEGFAMTVLAPEDPLAWRRWAFLQASFGEMTGTLRSLARYRQLAPGAAERDRAAAWLEAEAHRLEHIAPGGGQLSLD